MPGREPVSAFHVFVLLARQLLTPLERIDDAALLIDDGVIAAVGPRASVKVPLKGRVVDFGDAILAPGLIDITFTAAPAVT